MTLLTTLQVRSIMRKNHKDEIWTNKSKGHTGKDRRVKCYSYGDKILLSELRAAAGAMNVTASYEGCGIEGIIVKCVLA